MADDVKFKFVHGRSWDVASANFTVMPASDVKSKPKLKVLRFGIRHRLLWRRPLMWNPNLAIEGVEIWRQPTFAMMVTNKGGQQAK